MENDGNNPSRSSHSGDKGKQSMMTPQEEIPASSGTIVYPALAFVRSDESAFWNWGRDVRKPSSVSLPNGRESQTDAVQVLQDIERADEKLQEHRKLLPELKTLPPVGNVLDPTQDAQDYEKKLQFLYKVTDRFQGDERVNVFGNALTSFCTGTKDFQQMCNKMEELFIDNPDLLLEFWTFFPPPPAAADHSS